MSIALTALNLFAPTIGKVLDKLVPDSDTRDQINREIKLGILEQQDTINKQAGEIILAEAKSDHWIVASWRPILMLTIIGIVAWNYLIVGIAVTFGLPVVPLELPGQLWTLLQIGVGGYVVGRSGEKVTSMVMQNKKNDLGKF